MTSSSRSATTKFTHTKSVTYPDRTDRAQCQKIEEKFGLSSGFPSVGFRQAIQGQSRKFECSAGALILFLGCASYHVHAALRHLLYQ
jgi:hypothetical protein